MKNAISPALIRAARALLGWSQDDLSAASGVPKRTIARYELLDGEPQARTVERIKGALEDAGVEFIPENGRGAGVRMKAPTGILA